ncbi:MAG: hypothetical protein H7145_16850 [Akkermansiaceae bacterium]|nr:hypothetical protein [Armatimonadota bacterium]
MNDGEIVSADGSIGQGAAQETTRTVRVFIDRKATRQVITAFGGNFAISRFGDRDAQDSVGGHVLKNMPIGHARVGIPLKTFIKPSGDNYDAGHTSVKDVFRLMETLRDLKIPLVASVWDVPDFCVTNPEETNGRRIAPDKRDKVIAAITEWVRLARERHGLTVPYVSFSQADTGYSLLVPPEEARYFITRGGAALQRIGFPTKWLLGDTSNGESLAPYITTIMADKSVVPYLGPVSFHGWDSLTAPDDAYRAIAKAARLYRKPVWCLEAGYDAQLSKSDLSVWNTWDNALKLAQSYARCLTLAEASVMDYWQYQNDFPILGESDGVRNDTEVLSPSFVLYPAFHLIKMFAETFPAETQIVSAKVVGDSIYAVVGTEPVAAKLRILLVNVGESADVIVSGGQPNGKYSADGMHETQADRELSKVSLPLLGTDEKGTAVVSVLPRSVSVLREQ